MEPTAVCFVVKRGEEYLCRFDRRDLTCVYEFARDVHQAAIFETGDEVEYAAAKYGGVPMTRTIYDAPYGSPECVNADMLLILKRLCLAVEFRIDDPRAAIRDHAMKVIAHAEQIHAEGFKGGYG